MAWQVDKAVVIFALITILTVISDFSHVSATAGAGAAFEPVTDRNLFYLGSFELVTDRVVPATNLRNSYTRSGTLTSRVVIRGTTSLVEPVDALESPSEVLIRLVDGHGLDTVLEFNQNFSVSDEPCSVKISASGTLNLMRSNGALCPMELKYEILPVADSKRGKLCSSNEIGQLNEGSTSALSDSHSTRAEISFSAQSCGLSLKASATEIDVGSETKDASAYFLISNLVTLGLYQAYFVLFRAMEGDAVLVSRLNHRTAAMIALADAFDALVSLFVGLSSPWLFGQMVTVALLRFVVFAFCGVRLLLLIGVHRMNAQVRQLEADARQAQDSRQRQDNRALERQVDSSNRDSSSRNLGSGAARSGHLSPGRLETGGVVNPFEVANPALFVDDERALMHRTLYMPLVIGLLVCAVFPSWVRVVIALGLNLFWVPQIAQDVTSGQYCGLPLGFVVPISALRLVVPLYLWVSAKSGSPSSVCKHLISILFGTELDASSTSSNAPWVVGAFLFSLLVVHTIQILIVAGQRRSRARWFIPRAWLKPSYNYSVSSAHHPTVELSDFENQEKPGAGLSPRDSRVLDPLNGDCVVCMNKLRPDKSGKLSPSESPSSGREKGSDPESCDGESQGSSGNSLGSSGDASQGSSRRTCSAPEEGGATRFSMMQLLNSTGLPSAIGRVSRSLASAAQYVKLTTSSGDDSLDGLAATPCGHYFHAKCLEEWMRVKLECPTCRHSIPAME